MLVVLVRSLVPSTAKRESTLAVSRKQPLVLPKQIGCSYMSKNHVLWSGLQSKFKHQEVLYYHSFCIIILWFLRSCYITQTTSWKKTKLEPDERILVCLVCLVCRTFTRIDNFIIVRHMSLRAKRVMCSTSLTSEPEYYKCRQNYKCKKHSKFYTCKKFQQK